MNISITTSCSFFNRASRRRIILRDSTGQPKLPTVGIGQMGKEVVYSQPWSTTQRERRLELLSSKPSSL